MDYVQITDDDRREMLQTIGVDSADSFYDKLPAGSRLEQPLELTGLPAGRSELELQRQLRELVDRNRRAADMACFLGGGAYDHFIPACVDNLAGQGGFLTAYTPYQAEASQGALQAFFEFQTQVCQITGMEVANASLYEGATAVAEAVIMALNVTGKHRVLVASTVHRDYRRVLGTYLADLPAELIEIPGCAQTGRLELEAVNRALQAGAGDTACLVVQSPNVFGVIEDWEGLFDLVHQQGKALAVGVFNPVACGLLKRPGDCGADIAVGEGQPLGIPMQYGGPYLGLLAAKKPLMRKMPGRLIGQTTDQHGNRGYCLTLQTREQHIRGAKATSNVCTNQGLLALRATIYMSTVGAWGLKEVAQQCYHKAHYAADRIAEVDGYSLAYDGVFFHEFVVNCPVSARDVINAGRERDILAGLSCHELGIGGENQLLVAVTEKRTAKQIDGWVKVLEEVGSDGE